MEETHETGILSKYRNWHVSMITSTEILLNIICGTNKEAAAVVPAFPPTKGGIFKAPSFKIPSLTFPSLKKSPTVVGIDIGHECIYLAHSIERSSQKWQVINRRRLPLPPGAARSTPEFAAFLKATLSSFCVSIVHPNLWVIMSSAKVDVRYIRIPKVPKKQISNAVYWTARKNVPFDEKELIFDYDVQGEVIEKGIPKLAVMVYTAHRVEVEDTKNLFSKIGWPLTGISIVPFAMQNFFRTGCIPAIEDSVASLFIGNDFSCIDIYNGGNLVMTRGIKAGARSMVESLVDQISDLGQYSMSTALTIEQSRKIIQSLGPGSPPLDETDPGFDLRKEEVFEMIRPALERLVRQVERTFEHYIAEGSESVTKIFVSGILNIGQPFVKFIEDQLGINSAVLDFLSDQNQAAYQNVEDIRSISEHIAFAPAQGLSLSNNAHTPNLMFTYKDKEKAASVTRINRAVFIVFIVTVFLCTSIFVYQNVVISHKKAEIAKFETQLAGLGSAVDRDQLMNMMSNVAKRRQLTRDIANRYIGIVMISELTTMTPNNIQIINLKIDLGSTPDGGTAKPPEPSKTQAGDVTMDGVVLGNRQMLETMLTGYVMRFESSPVFKQVAIQKSAIESYMKNEMLHFTINMKARPPLL